MNSKTTEKTTVFYLSTLPGAGKTHWATTEMARRILNKERITLFVGPTLRLLKEVKSKLLEKTKKPDRIHLVDSNHGNVPSQVAQLLDMYVPDDAPKVFSPVEKGSVILMTHEAFLRLPPKVDKSKLSVIFDEARKFVVQMAPLGLKYNTKELELFRKMLKESGKTIKRNGKETQFTHLKLDKVPKYFKDMTASDAMKRQYPVMLGLMDEATNPNVDVYVYKDKRAKKQWSFQKVIMPARIFHGFKEMIIMAAFLHDSQMWHFLSISPEIQLIDITRSKYADKVNKIMKGQATKLIERFKAMTILPLTRQEQQLSINRLNYGILTPDNVSGRLRVEIEQLGVKSTKDIYMAYSQAGIRKANPKSSQAIDLIEDNGGLFHPFNWYTKIALEIIKRLKAAGKLKGKPLAACNKDFEHIIDNNPVFERISTQSHGLNTHMKSNCVYYAAGIQPNNQTKSLFNTLLPRYDINKDYLADSCVQCVTRSSVRDKDSKDKVYVILPDLHLAKLLYEKMEYHPKINLSVADRFNMVAFTTLLEDRQAPANKKPPLPPDEVKVRKKEATQRWTNDNKELARLRNKRTYWSKKKGKEAKAAIQDIEKQIAKLVQAKRKRL
jgi:hypothetical protein